MNPKWTRMHTATLPIVAVASILIGLWAPGLWAWLGILLLLSIFISLASQGITGQWTGWMIDERNRMSLSRMQMGLWTVVVLSGFFAAALANLAGRQPNPIAIALPPELWLLMGISTTSLVASPLIRSTKTEPKANDDQKAQQLELLAKQGVDQTKVDNTGLIVTNKEPKDALWSDLFKGEETGNVALFDLGKIQMFYFTLVLVLTYAMALGYQFATATSAIHEFPGLDSSIIALLGISHAGYLVNKVIPHSKTESETNPKTQ